MKIIITALLLDILIIFLFPRQSFFGMTQLPPPLHFIFSSVSNNPSHPASLPIRRLSPLGTLHPNMPSNLIYGWVSHSPLPLWEKRREGSQTPEAHELIPTQLGAGESSPSYKQRLDIFFRLRFFIPPLFRIQLPKNRFIACKISLPKFVLNFKSPRGDPGAK